MNLCFISMLLPVLSFYIATDQLSGGTLTVTHTFDRE